MMGCRDQVTPFTPELWALGPLGQAVTQCGTVRVTKSVTGQLSWTTRIAILEDASRVCPKSDVKLKSGQRRGHFSKPLRVLIVQATDMEV